MTVSMEFMLVIVINGVTAGIFLGGMAMAIKYIEKQIARLEEKQDKHNCLIERVVRLETKVDAAHLRMDISGITKLAPQKIDEDHND